MIFKKACPQQKAKEELILPHFPSYGKVSSYINVVIILLLFFSDVFMQELIASYR